MNRKMMIGALAITLSASLMANIRAVTPVPREDSYKWWMKRHQDKLAEISSNKVFDVVFVGDSIMHGFEDKRMRHWFWKRQITALNLGFSADRTEHVLWRIANGEMDGYKAKVIYLMIGTNNTGHFPIEEEAPADTVMGIRAILDAIRAKQPQAKIILSAIFPRGLDENEPLRRRNELVNQSLPRFCDDRDILWFNANSSFLTADGKLPRHIMPDRLHPSPEGYDVWVSRLLPLIKDIINGDRGPYIRVLPPFVPDDAATADLPPEAIPSNDRMSGESRNRQPGPFGDRWWLNRLHRNRELMAASSNSTVDVVFMGDSIMHFWEWKHPESWAKFTAKYSAFNCGYGGDRTQDVLWRVKNGELDGYKAKAVVLMIGTNNSSLKSKAKDTAEGVKQCIAAIREKQPQAKIILHPIFPRGGEKVTEDARARHVSAMAINNEINKIIAKYADGKDVIWCDFNSKLTPNGKWVPAELMKDQIHPTDKGYEIWMEALDPILSKICGK